MVAGGAGGVGTTPNCICAEPWSTWIDGASAGDMLIDRFMPVYDFYESHSIVISASPESVYQAIKELTAGEIPFFRLLMGARALPAVLQGKRLRRTDNGTPLLEQVTSASFVLLADV